MQLLLSASGVLGALQQAANASPRADAKATRAKKRLSNIEVLLATAGRAEDLPDLSLQAAVLDRFVDTSDGSEGSISSSSSSGQFDTVQLLRRFADYCNLQGEGDVEMGHTRGPQVSFLTMHASKGKEFPCVVAMGLYDGLLPSDMPDTDFEQERNTAYVAATRAKDHLLLIWPKSRATRNRRGWGSERVQVSRFVNQVLQQASKGDLPDVEVLQRYNVTCNTI